ncbi:MAG: hypothetical protein AAF614_32585 [Chloroflexota bacterium]
MTNKNLTEQFIRLGSNELAQDSNRYLALTLILLSTLLFVVACISAADFDEESNARRSLDPWTPLPTIEPRPDFVRKVSPPESMAIPYDTYHYKHPDFTTYGLVDIETARELDYKSEICLDIDLGELVQPGDNLAMDDATSERFQLIVNRGEILAEASNGLGGAVLVTDSTDPKSTWEHYTIFCWFVPLELGTHELTLKFQQTSGDIQKYSWQLALTNDTSVDIPSEATFMAKVPFSQLEMQPF